MSLKVTIRSLLLSVHMEGNNLYHPLTRCRLLVPPSYLREEDGEVKSYTHPSPCHPAQDREQQPYGAYNVSSYTKGEFYPARSPLQVRWASANLILNLNGRGEGRGTVSIVTSLCVSQDKSKKETPSNRACCEEYCTQPEKTHNFQMILLHI